MLVAYCVSQLIQMAQALVSSYPENPPQNCDRPFDSVFRSLSLSVIVSVLLLDYFGSNNLHNLCNRCSSRNITYLIAPTHRHIYTASSQTPLRISLIDGCTEQLHQPTENHKTVQNTNEPTTPSYPECYILTHKKTTHQTTHTHSQNAHSAHGTLVHIFNIIIIIIIPYIDNVKTNDRRNIT